MPKVGTSSRPAYFVYQLFWSSLDWLFPPVCGGCGKLGYRWCVACDEQAVKTGEKYCLICGSLLGTKNICNGCCDRGDKKYIIRSYSAYTGSVKNAIHQLKYKNDIGLGDALANPMIRLYQSLGWNVDIIVPIPISERRYHERGYNQAGLLAKPLALANGIEYQPEAVRKKRDTPSQVKLSAEKRKLNVQDAFQADPQMIKGKAICLVDDVTTTGATIQAAMDAVYLAGAKAVFGLTFAKAVLDSAEINDLTG